MPTTKAKKAAPKNTPAKKPLRLTVEQRLRRIAADTKAVTAALKKKSTN